MSEKRTFQKAPANTHMSLLWDNYAKSLATISRTEGVPDAIAMGLAFFPMYLAMSTIAIAADTFQASRIR